jgi:tetratricopeptide (TPR) repeat protein
MTAALARYSKKTGCATPRMMTRTAKSPFAAASGWSSPLFLILLVVALAYAFVAGLHTVTDSDLGWQLATGRWVAQHHAIPSTDVFSYTAQGEPWIYPVGAGLLFYAAYLLGGYALLSWLGAVACVGTVALLLRRGSAVSALLAVLAVPVIADRTTPRADMFTVVLSAAFLTLLWQQHEMLPPLQRTKTGHSVALGRAPLWLLPILMVAWVNLHLGFVAGLALVVIYVLIEGLEMVWPERRQAAIDRLRQSWPWLIATFAAALANPWGWRICQALLRQESAMTSHSQAINEWASVRLNWTGLTAAFSQRDPKSATLFVLLLVIMVAVPLAMWRRQIGAAILICSAALLAFRHERFGALFGLIVVVIGGAVLTPAITALGMKIEDKRMRSILAVGLTCLVVALAYARSADLVTDRAYLGSSTELGSFGTGLSWWFPEGAAAFIERENVPGQIFNSYNEGGYVVWRLGPKYRDYIDGRAIPFGSELFSRSAVLMGVPPGSPEWRQEAERYGINAMIIPLARYDALQYFPVLRQFCASDEWRPVYLDEVSAVFVRRRPETESLIQRWQVDCASAPLPAVAPAGNDSKAFNQWANAAAVLYVLGRNSEAFAATTRALTIFPDSAMIHIVRGNLLAQAGNLATAEQQYVLANDLEPTGYSWVTLAMFYGQQGRLAEKIDAWKHVVELAPISASAAALLSLGNSYLEAHRPQDALQSFEEAASRLPRQPATEDNANPILANLAHGRALAWVALGDANRAISLEEEAVRIMPNKPEYWTILADLYDRQGQHDAAQRARERINSLRQADSPRAEPGGLQPATSARDR